MINRYSAILAFVLCTLFTGTAAPTAQESGETLYKRHCASCHPVRSLKDSPDIIRSMRNPVAFMPRFDETKVSDADARMISDYISGQGNSKRH